MRQSRLPYSFRVASPPAVPALVTQNRVALAGLPAQLAKVLVVRRQRQAPLAQAMQQESQVPLQLA